MTGRRASRKNERMDTLLQIRIDADTKAAVIALAEREHRSMSAMVRVLIRREVERVEAEAPKVKAESAA